METFNDIVNTLCQPKVVAMLGVLVLVIASFMNNNLACETGVIIIIVATFWGFVS